MTTRSGVRDSGETESHFDLSILIPVYNWDAAPLLAELLLQAKSLSGRLRLELLVIDDGSEQPRPLPAAVAGSPMLRYQRFQENRGRVAIRNRLLEEARGKYILFLDCDMLPDNPDFLVRYVEQMTKGRGIVCGGISYLRHQHVAEDYRFYLYKSTHTEALPAEQRAKSPWRYLFTSNILLRRDISRQIPFDPRFSSYGFEDIEWALRLAESHTITHIDNSCSHMGIVTKEETFARMRQSIGNYALLLTLHPHKTAASPAVRVSNLLRRLPDPVLGRLDSLLSRLFFTVSWNPLLLFLFQGNKMVLLSKALKHRKTE